MLRADVTFKELVHGATACAACAAEPGSGARFFRVSCDDARISGRDFCEPCMSEAYQLALQRKKSQN